MNTFNTEIEQQWKQNQQQTSEEEFVDMVNFFHKTRKLELERQWSSINSRDFEDNDENSESDENSDQENKDEAENNFEENNFEEICRLTNSHPTNQSKRKSIRLCRHKLQGRTGCRPRGWRQ
jgi:hypothetical protein